MKSFKLSCVWFFLACFIIFACGIILGASLSPAHTGMSLSDSKITLSLSLSGEQRFLPQELNNNNNATVILHGIDSIGIRAGYRTVDLIQGLSNGSLSCEALASQAFTDARNGICTRSQTSRYGLSRFCFHYTDFDLCVTCDVFESTEGKRFPVFSLDFYRSGQGISTFPDPCVYSDDGTPIDTLYDNWELDFAVEKVEPEEITLNVDQRGGQAVGDLVIQRYVIYQISEDVRIEQGPVCSMEEEEAQQRIYPIQTGGVTEITITWEKVYGSLPVGKYELFLTIENQFAQGKNPPHRNYTNRQRYVIPFEIQ